MAGLQDQGSPVELRPQNLVAGQEVESCSPAYETQSLTGASRNKMAPGARLELALTVLETVVLAAGRPRYVRTWCRERHSKTQPHDYRSCALPLELSRRMESGVRIELTISCSQNERIASNAYPARTWSWRGDSNPGFILTKDVSC